MMLFAGITVFLLGLKLMSGGLSRGAGKSMKKMFMRMGDNRFASLGVGIGATAITNSSTATTVMTIGFVNAGVMTLLQATGIILGANVGTTLTAYLVALERLPISHFFMGSGIIGIFMYMFGKRKKVVLAGEIITGLSIIFIGMHLMGRAFDTRGNDAALRDIFESVFLILERNRLGPLLLVILGTVFTVISQSSTVTTSLVVTLAATEVISIYAAIFVVMGANFGTTVTALIASIGVTTNAKRTALLHFIFNLLGVVVLLPIIWPLRFQTASVLGRLSSAPQWQVAFFHTFFNAVPAIIMLIFIKQFTRLAIKIIPSRLTEHDEPRLYYIDKSNIDSLPADHPQLDLVLKETLSMANFARKSFLLGRDLVLDFDEKLKSKLIYTEQQINFIHKGIGQFLVNLPKDGLSKAESKLVKSLHYTVSDVERIGDYAIGFLNEVQEMLDNNHRFSETARAEIEKMFADVDKMFDMVLNILETQDKTALTEIEALESAIDESKHNYGLSHISRLESGQCTVDGGTHFYAIITGLERVADHLMNIAFGIENSSGAQLDRLKRSSKKRVKTITDKDAQWQTNLSTLVK